MDYTGYVTLQAINLYLLILEIVRSFPLPPQSPVLFNLVRTDRIAMKPCCGYSNFYWLA